jgi:hypothetical protein
MANCRKCDYPLNRCLCGVEDLINSTIESQLDIQIDGDHYKHFAIQPAEFTFKNKFNWHQGEIIKYISRYKLKHGRDDLEKARHLIDMLIEFEYETINNDIPE